MSVFIILAVFLLSGAVILCCLQKLGYTVAKNAFLAVYGLLSICIPFTLGSELTMKIMLNTFFNNDPAPSQLFWRFMMKNLNVGISVFSATTVVIAVASLIVFIAFVIVSVYATIKIVRFIHRIGSSGTRKKIAHKTHFALYRAIKNIYGQKIYLRFCRLLN